MKHASLFSGIGGFDLAAEWMGWTNVFNCEIDSFCRKVLNYYWPDTESYTDIKTTSFRQYEGKIDILTGGFPCQGFSYAGKRKGKDDDRYLWPYMLRTIRQVKPTWVIGENVPGIINLALDTVLSDLEKEGYTCQTFNIPACAINAPHRRSRIWIVAYNNSFIRGKGWQCKPREQSRYKKSIKEQISRNGSSADTCTGNTRQGNAPKQGSGECTIEQRKTQDSRTISGQSICRGVEKTGSDLCGEFQTKITADTDELRGEKEYELQQTKLCEQSCQKRVIADTNINQRCKRRMHETRPGTTGGHAGSCDSRTDRRQTWDNFPTQSPLCSRDDGVSLGLDGITFSKWRNESIKAYGNAVVPALVYEIFKIIEHYDYKINA